MFETPVSVFTAIRLVLRDGKLKLSRSTLQASQTILVFSGFQVQSAATT
jgi:hypothetical protein